MLLRNSSFKKLITSALSVLFIFSSIPVSSVFAAQNLRQQQAPQSDSVTALAVGQDLRTSGIELSSYVPYAQRLQIARFHLAEGPADVDYVSMENMMRENPENYDTYMRQMRAVIEAHGIVITTDDPRAIIRAFLDLAIPKIRSTMDDLKRRYDLDPEAEVVIEWGSRRAAHYRLKNGIQQRFIFNMNLLLDDIVLEGEAMHEALHPLVNVWLQYLHIEYPEIFTEAGIDARAGISKPVKPGYLANVWDWDFNNDNMSVLFQVLDTFLITNPEEYSRLAAVVENTFKIALRAINKSNDMQTRDAGIKINIRFQEMKNRPVNEELEEFQVLLRAALDCLDGSREYNDRIKARNLRLRLDRRLNNAQTKEGSGRFKNILDAIALREALAEVYIIMKELQFYGEPENIGRVAEAFRDNSNILDSDARFAGLLELEGDEQIGAIIQHLRNEDLYSTKREFPRGAAILARLWDKSPFIVKPLFGMWDERLQEMNIFDIRVPNDLDDLIDILRSNDVALIDVRFIDPDGKRLQGQRKTVLMPIDSSRGLLQGGVSFDGSSIPSSVDGEPLGEIFQSDFVSRVIPESLSIYRDRQGRVVAELDAAAMLPMENVPYVLKRNADAVLGRPAVRVGKGLELEAARQEAIRLIRASGVTHISVIANDWAEHANVVTVAYVDLEPALTAGVELGLKNTAYMPTTGSKAGLRALPDPYSLRFIKYADGSQEAIMQADIVKYDGAPFEGDFRQRLKALTEEAFEKGYVSYMSPEPEVFFFRRLEDGGLVTADAEKYYDDISRLPDDLKQVFHEVLIAAQTAGIRIRYIHHEVAQGQFEMPYEHDTAMESADTTVIYKYILENVAMRHGLQVSFMPKPVEGINGSGMHVHQSLVAVDDGRNLFYDQSGKFRLSTLAQQYIAGLLEYVPGFLRITNPDANSYARLVPHYEAPTYRTWGAKNRSALVRVPAFSSPNEARFELRLPDPSGNIYAKFSAMFLAGLMGIEEQLAPPTPVEEESVFDMTDERKAELGITELPGGPGGLEKACQAMDSPEMDVFVTRFVGPKGTPVRDYLSKPVGVRTAPSVQIITDNLVDGRHIKDILLGLEPKIKLNNISIRAVSTSDISELARAVKEASAAADVVIVNIANSEAAEALRQQIAGMALARPVILLFDDDRLMWKTTIQQYGLDTCL